MGAAARVDMYIAGDVHNYLILVFRQTVLSPLIAIYFCSTLLF